jgi:hypothetical protein
MVIYMNGNFKGIIILVTAFLLVFQTRTHAREIVPRLHLPAGGVVIETESLKPKGYPDRAIVLWMLNPAKNPSSAEDEPDAPYTCPDETRGSHYSGFVRFSLVNTSNNTIINTIELPEPFDISYRIRKGPYYHVQGKSGKGGEYKAHVLFLKDYNGDGQALEFALFDALACMGLPTSLFGYNPKKDKVMQYQIRLEMTDAKERSIVTSGWCDYLFSQKPRSAGVWKYCIDYRGRGGTLDTYKIRYVPEKEGFEGTMVSTSADDAECNERLK